MKKVILASAIALSFMGMVNTASAAESQVQFIGAVTSATCDLTPEVGGAVSQMIQLGTVNANSAGTAMDFTLKPAAGTACAGVDSKTAEISWGGNFDTQGLLPQSGTATDAWVKLVAVNSITANEVMNKADASADFDGSLFAANGAGAKFTAQLNGGSTVGDYQSAAAFVVAYK